MKKKLIAIPALTLAPYTALDCVGALLTFPVSSGSPGQRGATIKRLTVIDAEVQDEEYLLHLFTASPQANARTDAAAYVPNAADLALKICTFHIEVADYLDSATDSIVSYELDTAIVYDGLNLYGILECIATPDYAAADDLTVNIVMEL